MSKSAAEDQAWEQEDFCDFTMRFNANSTLCAASFQS